jgi:hypothetical protein
MPKGMGSCVSVHQSNYERSYEQKDERQPPAPSFRQGSSARNPRRDPEQRHDRQNERRYGQERQQNILRATLGK